MYPVLPLFVCLALCPGPNQPVFAHVAGRHALGEVVSAPPLGRGAPRRRGLGGDQCLDGPDRLLLGQLVFLDQVVQHPRGKDGLEVAPFHPAGECVEAVVLLAVTVQRLEPVRLKVAVGAPQRNLNKAISYTKPIKRFIDLPSCAPH